MRKIAILVVATLLLVSGMTAAWAYNTATVTNAGDITINNTNAALLALVPRSGVGNLDLTADINNGNLVFHFGRGNNPWFGGDQLYGLQKNSVYIWGYDAGQHGLFTYQNRSAETIVVWFQVLGLPPGVSMYFAGKAGDPANSWVDMTDGAFHQIQPLGWGSVASGYSCEVCVKIVVADTASFPQTTALTVNVKATAVP
jgi:hypothetical protein